MTTDDFELLARYARDGAEDAFAVLVRRHSGLVYSVALRIVRSPQMAEEVSQSVFIELSRNAKRMNAAVILSAWLYRVTRSKSVDAMRRESRRQRREQVAVALDSSCPAAPEAENLEPLLDDALDSLTEKDRAAIVMRFFERKSLTDVGDALGISTDAAQKRVTRAVDQLRAFFTKRGLTATSAVVAVVLTANSAKAAPAGLATGICTAVKASVSTLSTTGFVSTILTITAKKAAVAAIITLAAGITIYQIQKGSEVARKKKAGQSMGFTVSSSTASSGTMGGAVKNGPRYFLKPRLSATGKRHLQQDPGGVLSEHAAGFGVRWSREDGDLLVAWAALDPDAAMKWVEGGERRVGRVSLLGAVAAGILLRDGKDAAWRFLDKQRQDQDGGELEKNLFYHLGREDSFDVAMEILREKKDGELAGMMITNIEEAQYQTNAIDYMEALGIPVSINYWILQDDINKDPRFWADWALQRDSDLLPEIVDGWARDYPNEAKAWVEERVPKDDKHRAEIDELMQIREAPIPTDQPDMDQSDMDQSDMDQSE